MILPPQIHSEAKNDGFSLIPENANEAGEEQSDYSYYDEE